MRRMHSVIFMIPSALLLSGVGCIKCLDHVNRPYDVFTEKGSVHPHPRHDRAAPVDRSDAVELRLVGLLINDVVGNDFERCLLAEAGIAESVDGTCPKTGTAMAMSHQDTDSCFSDRCQEQIEKAIERARARQALAVAEEDPVGVAFLDQSTQTVREKIENEIANALKAHYSVQVRVLAQSFDLSSTDRTVDYKYDFDQDVLGEPTTRRGNLQQLLFRGKNVDIYTLRLTLTRKSAIASVLQGGVEKLEESDFFAKLLKGALVSLAPGLGDLGKQLGRQIDRQVYKFVRERYGPNFELGNGSFEFITTDGDMQPIPADADDPFRDGLFLGKQELLLKARLRNPRENEQGVNVLLTTSLSTKPVRARSGGTGRP